MLATPSALPVSEEVKDTQKFCKNTNEVSIRLQLVVSYSEGRWYPFTISGIKIVIWSICR